MFKLRREERRVVLGISIVLLLAAISVCGASCLIVDILTER